MRLDVQTLLFFHNSNWFYPFWALLFSISLMLLWFYKEKWRKGFNVFFWPILLAVVIVYCPLLAKILVPRFMDSAAEYERLAWLFFEVPLMSYVFIMLTTEFKERKNALIFAMAFLALLFFFGSPDNRNYFKKADNPYKISQDAVTLCNKINALSPQGPVVLSVQLSSIDRYYYGDQLDGALYYGIRMYESRFRLKYNCIPKEQYSQDNFQLSNDLPADIDYYLCPKADNLYRELNRLGYIYVDETENFAIFHNEQKPTNGEGS